MPAAFLLSSPRTTPSRMTPVTRTAAAVRATMWIRRLSCWTSLWREPRAQRMLTVRPRRRGPCSGLFAQHPASAPPAAPRPAHPHLLVSISHHMAKIKITKQVTLDYSYVSIQRCKTGILHKTFANKAPFPSNKSKKIKSGTKYL